MVKPIHKMVAYTHSGGKGAVANCVNGDHVTAWVHVYKPIRITKKQSGDM